MSELAETSITAFDIIVVAVLFISAVMSLSRGLMREASSVLAFVFGGFIAYFALITFRDTARDILPVGDNTLIADALVVVIGFLAAYLLAGWVGTQLSKLIHASPEIGSLDRVAGAAFGAARGALAIILFVLLMHMMIPRDSTPGFIANSKLYPYADGAARWISSHLPGYIETAQDNFPSIDGN